jgi:hypothetical protein
VTVTVAVSTVVVAVPPVPTATLCRRRRQLSLDVIGHRRRLFQGGGILVRKELVNCVGKYRWCLFRNERSSL